MLLYSTNNKRIVKSIANGIMQHDINTWECFGQFLVKGKLSNISVKIDKRIKEWNKNYTDRELKDMIISLRRALLKIKEREKNILLQRFMIGKTQMEIADELGISQAQVSRLEKSAIENVRKLIK